MESACELQTGNSQATYRTYVLKAALALNSDVGGGGDDDQLIREHANQD